MYIFLMMLLYNICKLRVYIFTQEHHIHVVNIKSMPGYNKTGYDTI